MTTVLVFLSTAALAPFSVSNAFTAVDMTSALQSQLRAQQQAYTADAGTSAHVDTSIEAAASEAAQGSSGVGASPADKGALYTLQQFMFSGSIAWSGYKFTYYSQQVLPGPGLQIPGRHVNGGGYVSDEDGYIVLAGSAPKGTVFETPFGYQGKIYDRGTVGNHLDVYIR